MTTIVLKGEPISTQHLYASNGRGGRFMTPAAKVLKQDYGWQAKTQWQRTPLVGPVHVAVRLFFKDNKRRDWDNFHKISFDALEGIVSRTTVRLKAHGFMVTKTE